MPARKKVVHTLGHNRHQTILPWFDHCPPPIWSLDITGFVRFLFTFLIIFAANGSVQNPDIMYCNVFGSGFSIPSNCGSLVLSKFNIVLVYAEMQYVLAWCILYSADWPSRLLEKHSCQFVWNLSTLKTREENLQRWWWIARRVEPIPWYCKGELRSRMPTLGFRWGTLHCPQKSVFSRYSWKPAHHRLM